MRIRRRTRRGLNWGTRGCAPRFNLFPFLSGGRATTGTMVRWAQINRDASMFSRRKVPPRHSGVAPHLTSPCFPHANVAVALPGHAGVQYYDRAAMIPPSSNIAATLAARTQQVGWGPAAWASSDDGRSPAPEQARAQQHQPKPKADAASPSHRQHRRGTTRPTARRQQLLQPG